MSSEDTQPHRSASRGCLSRTHSLNRLAVALSCPPKQLWDSLWPHLLSQKSVRPTGNQQKIQSLKASNLYNFCVFAGV